MNKLAQPRYRRRQRRGAALILAVALMFALFSFLAFSIDTGYIAQSEAEMQRAADASALAGCWELHSQMVNGYEMEEVKPSIRQSAAGFASLNPVNNAGPQLSTNACNSDIQVGYLTSLSSTSISSDSANPFYAVRATVTKNAQKNGEVPFFFGKIFGKSGQAMAVSATAAMSGNIAGFELPPGSAATLDILPFALDETTWNALQAGVGNDQYSYNSATGSVSPGSDGVLEVNLFPQGTGSPGNRGTVDIGASGNSTNDIKRQILDGISSQDLIDLGKPLLLDGNGTMTLNGDTGISAGVKTQLNSIVGEPRIIPVFSNVTGNGNNATYTIVKWVGVRVLYVKLTGSMSSKIVSIQPCHVTTQYSVTGSAGSDNSDFVLTPVTLAR